MNTLIFRTIAPLIVAVMMGFSLYALLRGHDAPGGGFVGGLIAASAVAILGMSSGVPAARKALAFDPLAMAGFGVFVAAFSGLMSLFADAPYLTGLWAMFRLGESDVALSTPLLFDIGVYLTVLGTIASVLLALQDEGEGE